MEVKEKFYTCRYDRPFKEIMLKKENEDILKLFLEDILKVKISTIEIKSIERNSGNLNVKRKYLDVLLKTNAGKLQIEVNACSRPYVRPRNMAYISDIYASHTLVGESYTEDTNIIQINFTYGLKDDKKIRVYKVRDEEGKEFVRNLLIYEINMEYYKKIWDNGSKKEIEENKYYIMLDLEIEDLKKITKDKVVEKYMDNIEKLNVDIEFREYMTHEEDLRKIQNSLRREAIEEGIKEGLEKGIKQGIEKGIEQGVYQRTIELVKKFKEIGTPIEDISKATSLSVKEIEKI